MKDYYKILNVEKDADYETLKKSYRELVKQYHPDKTRGNEELEEKFKDVAEAYEVLSSEEKRSNYDLALSLDDSDYMSVLLAYFAKQMEDVLYEHYKKEKYVEEKVEEYKKESKWYKFTLLGVIDKLFPEKEPVIRKGIYALTMFAILVSYFVVIITTSFSWLYIFIFLYVWFSNRHISKLQKYESNLWKTEL